MCVLNSKKAYKTACQRDDKQSIQLILKHKHDHFGYSHMQTPHTLIYLCKKPVSHNNLKEIAETFYTKVLQEHILQKGNSHLES